MHFRSVAYDPDRSALGRYGETKEIRGAKDPNDIFVFTAVARYKRLSAAAKFLKLSKLNISRRIGRLSASGLKQQDNDLVLIYSIIAAHRFNLHFDTMWSIASKHRLNIRAEGNDPFSRADDGNGRHCHHRFEGGLPGEEVFDQSRQGD
jgi:hypothetical protein